MKYTLKAAISLGEGLTCVTELGLREEVVAGDLRGIKAAALSDPSVDDILKLVGRLSGQPDAVVNKLSIPDLNELGGLVLGFLSRGQEIGTGV